MKNLKNLKTSSSFINEKGAGKDNNKSCMVLDSENNPIAQTFSNSLKEAEANAKLIAAAPELLEQLSRVIKAVQDGSINTDHIAASYELIKKATD